MATSSKITSGNFFEDFSRGQIFRHAIPRTITEGDLALYIALTGDRRPLNCSSELARRLGFEREIAHDLLVFHIVFGRAVPDVSLNSPANLGYADVRFGVPVYPGDTLRAETEVIAKRETSKGDVGIVWVRTRGYNQRDELVLHFYRWAMVNKRKPDLRTGDADSPDLPAQVALEDFSSSFSSSYSAFLRGRERRGRFSSGELQQRPISKEPVCSDPTYVPGIVDSASSRISTATSA